MEAATATSTYELYEIFSVNYGTTGKSKGWKVQGPDKVHTAKTKSAAIILSENMKNKAVSETSADEIDLSELIAEEFDAETSEVVPKVEETPELSVMTTIPVYTMEELRALRPKDFSILIETVFHVCPICGKTKKIRSFFDFDKYEIWEDCRICRKRAAKALQKSIQKAEVEVIVTDVLEAL